MVPINPENSAETRIMKLSVIIPAYNEQATIGRTIKRLVLQKQIFEIIVVDDASRDGTTGEVLKIKDKRLSLLRHTQNRGKGAAIRTGLQRVKGDYVLIQDADNEYDPADIPKLLQPIADGKSEVVYGSRFMGSHSNMFFWHSIGNKFLNVIVNLLYNSTLSDMETGYKVIPTDLLRSMNLRENDFRFEVEVTCKLLKKQVKIYEVPISYAGRNYEEGKKITWVDGFRAVSSILGIRLSGEEFVLPSVEPLFQTLRINAVNNYAINGGVLLDIGCDEPPMIINRWKKRMAKCIGIDAVAIPRKYENVEIMRQEIDKEIKLPKETADTITLLAVLEHMKHPADILKECARLLKNKGVLLVTVPSPYAKTILEGMAKIGLVRQEMIDQHENYFTQKQLRDLVHKAGLEIVQLKSFEFGLNTLLVARKKATGYA